MVSSSLSSLSMSLFLFLSSSPEFGGVTNCLTTLGWWVWVCIRLCLVMVVVYMGEQMLLSTLALKQRVPLQ